MGRKPATPASDAPASSFNRASRREWNQKKKDLATSDNPEREPEARDNSLFGDKKRSREAGSSDAGAEPKKKPQKHRQEVLKEDPAVALARKSKAAAKAAGGPRAGGGRPPPRAEGAKQPYIKDYKSKFERGKSAGDKASSNRRHGEEVEDAIKAWEKLRQEKTPSEERERLIDEVLASFADKMVEVLQKHDAARILQVGSPRTRLFLLFTGADSANTYLMI